MDAEHHLNALGRRVRSFELCVAIVLGSRICVAQGAVQESPDAMGALAVELLSHVQRDYRRLAVYDGRQLMDSMQFCAATSLELLTTRLDEITHQSIARVPTVGGRSAIVRASARYNIIWGILGTRITGDSLVVRAVTAVNFETQPRSWSAQVADYFIVPSGTGWRVSDIRNRTISDGACFPGVREPPCDNSSSQRQSIFDGRSVPVTAAKRW